MIVAVVAVPVVALMIGLAARMERGLQPRSQRSR
jgi:hypothetical protein